MGAKRVTFTSALCLLLFSFIAGMVSFDKNLPPRAAYYYIKHRIIPYDSAHNAMYGIRVSQFKTLHTNPRFVMLGDSMTTLGEWTELLPSNDVSDRGIIQDTSEGVLSRLDVSAPGDSTVFLMIGANDALEGISTDVTKRNIAAIVHRLSPKHRVYLQSTVLTRFRRANQNILSLDAFEKGLCSSGECQFVDLNRVLTVGGVIDPSLTVDGTHLNGAGYWRWAGLISPLIQTPIITAQR